MSKPVSESPKIRWMDAVRHAVQAQTLVKVTLSGTWASTPTLRRVLGRLVDLKAGMRVSLVFRHDTRDVTQNFELKEGVDELSRWLDSGGASGFLRTTDAEWELSGFADGPGRLREMRPQPGLNAPAVNRTHDRSRKRAIAPGESTWLGDLGVTTQDGSVCAGKEAKFRQIHRFVEVLGALFEELPDVWDGSVRTLIDMGCGKGYLTFAATEYLRKSSPGQWKIRGIEQRPELVELSNRAALEAEFTNLVFETGSIQDVAVASVDVLVALHACDTATDDALASGIAAGAQLLLVSPCCHKEVRPQMKPPPFLESVLRHGIWRERHAEFVTDALRTLLLEWAGYRTRVFEFISPEHTGRNLMIAAVKRSDSRGREERALSVRELAGHYGIATQRLAERLGFQLSARPQHPLPPAPLRSGSENLL
ncbi:MAG: SAM-dependent methyltransferase [Pedosphaera sp.]|nr:SAM-dependent methyltransferase [Pedosphaera sp.]